MSKKSKKILVIRFSSIGDIVLTSPVVRCLKQQLDAEIHFLTKVSYAFIVESNPNVDKVFSIKKDISEVLDDLKLEQYDYVIDLHKNLRSLQVKLRLGVQAASFEKLNYKKWLLTNFKINKLPPIHIVDRYLATVQFLNVKNDGKGLDYFIPKAEELDIQKVLKKQVPYIAFAIGAAHATKCLPKGKMVEICDALDQPIILLGGPDDLEKGNHIAEKSERQIINLCGQLTVHQSASVIKQAHLVITHDTGMMHIAAAFQKTIISIWGNTVPAFGMYPYYPEDMEKNTSFEVSELGCRPCSKIGYPTCPKKHFNCMNLQSIKEIVAHSRRVFESLR